MAHRGGSGSTAGGIDSTVVSDDVLPVRVDPIIVLQDVLRRPGPDTADAAEHLRRAILEGKWRG
ncbi:hypothetical protein [Rhodococcus jostii]|uniref:hypothetical protein n=1 Tax=Rhodococcus jostii TaxID=132919 RepID=UPI001F072DF2|nr:hypothetical protein [Rhodococcus jostii]